MFQVYHYEKRKKITVIVKIFLLKSLINWKQTIFLVAAIKPDDAHVLLQAFFFDRCQKQFLAF